MPSHPDPTPARRDVSHDGSSTVIRLGIGEFVDPDGDAAVGVGCYVFLNEAVRLEPRIIQDLRGEPLRAFRAYVETPWNAGDDGSLSLVGRVEQSIADWKRRWHLHDRGDWIRSIAQQSLLRWIVEDVGPDAVVCSFPPDERFIRAALAAGGVRLEPVVDDGSDPPSPEMIIQWSTTQSVTLQLPGVSWDPHLERRDVAMKRIRDELDVALDAELDRIAAEMTALGARSSPTKRTGTEHFTWLARYQILGESFATIARSVHRSRQTVKDAVHETADLLHLDLRDPDPPGRPRRATKPRIVRVPPHAT